MTEKKHKFPVIEIFGPTIQGEGPDVGQVCSFVRLAFCDFDCPMCDTRYSWDQPEFFMMTAEAIWSRLCLPYSTGQVAPAYVVISGGNPAMQANLGELIVLSSNSFTKWSVETQGSVWNEWLTLVDHIVLSPKLSSQHQIQSENTFESFLRNFDRPLIRRRVTIKVVVFTPKDIDEAIDTYFKVGHRLGVDRFYLSVGTHEGDNPADILERYAHLTNHLTKVQFETMHLNTLAILPQVHVLLWGQRRGI